MIATTLIVILLSNAPAPEPVVVDLPVVESVPRPPQGMQIDESQMQALIATYFPPEWRTWALNVSWCESRWTTNAKNPRSTAAGLFQFLRSTWDWVSTHTGTPTYDEGGVWEVHSQMINAAWLVNPNNGGPSHWVCKG